MVADRTDRDFLIKTIKPVYPSGKSGLMVAARLLLLIANVSDFGRLTLLQVPGKTACLSRSSEIL